MIINGYTRQHGMQNALRLAYRRFVTTDGERQPNPQDGRQRPPKGVRGLRVDLVHLAISVRQHPVLMAGWREKDGGGWIGQHSIETLEEQTCSRHDQ